MKRIILTCLIASPIVSVAQQLPQPSPLGRVEQIVGLTTIKVDYSRPSARDRVIFGDLVPFGKVWRTGANKCTTIITDGPVKVEGDELPAGAYSLFTIPNDGTWVIIFNKDTSLWGDDARKDSLDVLTVKAAMSKDESMTETFTIDFEEVKDDMAQLVLRWEHIRVGIALHADATSQGIENIKEALKDPKANYSVYNRSARFCVDRNIQLASALEWAEKSASMERKYWNLHTLALARAANGKYKEAIAAAEESMTLAQKEEATDYVKKNKAKIEEWSRMPGAK